MPSPSLPQPLIWINGWPGVGKQTVGQCLASMLGADKAILIDSDQFTDHLDLPPDALRSSRPDIVLLGEEEEEERAARRSSCFARYVEGGEALGRIVIFADCQPDDRDGGAEAHEYARAAARAGRPFAPVYMTCGEEERRRRVQAGAATRAAPKAAGAARARARARGGGELFRFGDGVRALCVDVTGRGAHEAAMEVLTFVHALEGRLRREEGCSSAEGTPVEEREPEWKQQLGRG